MLLDRLQIQAFRGIRNTIDLPLDAPLTILLAANGTAKTTVCDATEWLLTGRIRRLQPGLIAPEAIRNLYAQPVQPRVWATARWRTITGEIARTEPGALTVPAARGTAGKTCTTGKLLEQLTPEYVGQTSRTRNVEEPRAEWLRAVRFFCSDGLELLIDDGEAPERVRGIAFAELLGVGPVGRRIEGLKGVRAQIDSPKAALTAVTDRIVTLERQLREEQSSISAPYLARVDALLREIAAAGGVTLPETLARRREVLLSLRERTMASERTFAGQRVAFAQVRNSFAAYQTALQTVKKWREVDQPASETRLADLNRQRDALQKELQRLVSLSSESTQRLSQANILLGQTQGAMVLARLEAPAGETPDRLAVAQARAAAEEARKLAHTAQEEQTRWKRLGDQFPAALRTYHQLDLLEKHRLELSQTIPSAEDQEATERRLRESTLRLTQLRTQLKASTDRWQRWGAEVRAQAANWTAESACPLCGHDHKEPAALHHAIEEVLAQQPAADRETADQLAQLEAAVSELRTNSATMIERRKQLTAIETQVAELKDGHLRFLALVRERGLDEQIFGRLDATEIVANRSRVADEARAAATKAVETAAQRARQIERVHAGLQEAAQALRNALPAQAVANLPSDPSLQDRFREVELLITVGQQQVESLRVQYDQAMQAAETAREKLAALDQALQQAREGAAPLRQKVEDSQKVVAVVEEAWRGVSGEALDAAAIERMSAFQQQRDQQLQSSQGQLTQAEEHLGLAEQAMREEAARSEAGKALAASRQEQAALLRVDLLRTKLDSAIEEAERNLTRLLSTQIQPLLRSISSFYLRTQGNPFIDRIGVDDSPNTNVLRWLGQLADARALGAGEMSQGQRQDLALSIFLARARQERGTFILDEPLAHLDDLNRVAFFDSLRAMLIQTSAQPQPVRLVVTTASWSLVRHLKAKFLHVRANSDVPMLRVLELVGDPRSGVEVRVSN